MNETEITYELKSPFEYHFKGDTRQARFITLNAPSVSIIGYVGRLKQGFMKAVTNAGGGAEISDEQREAAKDAGADGFSGDDILMLLAASEHVQFDSYLTVAREAFAAPGVALIDGEQTMTKALMDRLSADDFQSMLGQYLKVFIVASALKAMEK